MTRRTPQIEDQITPQQLDFGGEFRPPERQVEAPATHPDAQRQDDKSLNSKSAASYCAANKSSVNGQKIATSGLNYAEDHWLAVNQLTKALRKRSKGQGANPSRRSVRNDKGQKNLWLPTEANDGAQDFVNAQVQSGRVTYQINSKAVSSVGREAGLQVCRHLVAALRLQHEQELAVQDAALQNLAV